MSSFYKNKKVLVAGGTGTIGTVLVKKLMQMGAKVTVVSIDDKKRAQEVLGTLDIFRYGDLRDYETCLKVTKNQDYVFNLMAVKGSSQIGLSKVASGYVPFILCNTNLMEASFRSNVNRFLFVGSIGEYPPLSVRREDDMWSGAPTANDRFSGIAKRAGEAQAETYLYEFGWDAVRIVRPSNVYGPFDDFDPKTAQVIPALINRMVNGENPIHIAGDGSAKRDFIFSGDVADGMLVALEKAPPCVPINLGSGKGYSIKSIATIISNLVPKKPIIQWDPSKPTSDKIRILDTKRAIRLLDYKPKTSLKMGIKETIDWYLSHKDLADKRGRELHG